MSELQVSVVIPAYNCEKYVGRAIESLLGQTEPVEIVLVDDGSTDQTLKVCEGYQKKYRNIIIQHVPNGGAARAREIGIGLANGAYIGFLDSDDWVKPDMYEKLVSEMKRLQLDMIQCGFINTDHYEQSDSTFSKQETRVFDRMTALRLLYGVLEEEKGTINYLLWNKLFRAEILTRFPMPAKEININDVPVIPKAIYFCERIGVNLEPFVYYFHRNDQSEESIMDALWKSKGKAIYAHITAFNNVTQYFKQINQEVYELSLAHTVTWCLSAIKQARFMSEECMNYAIKLIKSEKAYQCKYLGLRKRIASFAVVCCPQCIIMILHKILTVPSVGIP